MIETQALLSRIAALKQRLEQAQVLVKDAGEFTVALASHSGGNADTAGRLGREVAQGFRHSGLLETALRQLPGSESPALDTQKLPKQLTSRASQLLRRGQELLVKLRSLADEPLLQGDERQTWPAVYRQTTILTDLILRTLQALPESPSAQLRLCEGLEAVASLTADKLALLHQGLSQGRHEEQQLTELAELLSALADGKLHEQRPLEVLAEALLAEAQSGAPIRYLHADPAQPARFVAAHCLTVAQVIARLARADAEWRGKLLEPILAALVYDVGMLQVPVEILSQPHALDDSQRRIVEAHPRVGGEMVAQLGQNSYTLAEAAACHHERIDGTGYPSGLRDYDVRPLVRLLSVCDVYVAMCSPRPHRAALETRTALTDTLLLAEQGGLDRIQAERLLTVLSFYPVGSAVELADGAIGVVVATHAGRRDLNTPARPVLALVIDSQGQPLAAPQHIDLADCEGRSIVRTLSAPERQEMLGKRHPLWV